MRISEGRGIRVETVDAGTLAVDGGAMFGVVPREAWRRYSEPDERNLIPLAMRCLLVVTPEVRILVDTGAGNKWTPESGAAYRIENAGRPTRLEDSLGALGVAPGDIDIVLLTHLHFDHAGGATRRAGEHVVPSFPNARHLVRRGEWEVARSGDRRLAAGYAPHDFEPLAARGLLEPVEGPTEIVPGVRLVDMPGHTRDHQGVLIDVGHETVCYPADLVPTSAHVRPSWIMAYDLEPLVTWAEKERWLTRAGTAGWRLVFEHDPVIAAARARPSPTGIGCELEDRLCEDAAGPPAGDGGGRRAARDRKDR